MLENGLIIKCTERESTPGRMEGSMKETISVTKRVEEVYIIGRTVEVSIALI